MNTILAATIVSSALWQGAAFPPVQQANEVAVATYKIAGRDVQAKFPDVHGPFENVANFVELKGAKYFFRDGKLIRRLQGEGGWGEYVRAYSAAKANIGATTPEWRVKVQVIERFDILDASANGFLSQRKHIFEARQTEQILESLARFAAMAEAASGGAIKIRIETEFDSDWARFEPSSGGLSNGGYDALSDYLRGYLKPRINGGLFEAEDRIYRGPWDSVFVIHSGMTGRSLGFTIYDAPVTPIAFYVQGAGLGNYAMSQALFDGWCTHVRAAAAHHGFGQGPNMAARAPELAVPALYGTPEEAAQGFNPMADPEPFVPEGLWGKLLNRTDPTTADYIARRATLNSASGLNWEDVGAAKMWSLPEMDEKAFGALTGNSKPVVTESFVEFSPGSTMSSALDDKLEWGKEAMAAVSNGARDTLIVDAEYVDLVGSKIKKSFDAKVYGWRRFGGRVGFVFTINKLSTPTTEADLIEGAPADAASPEPPVTPLAFGTYRIAKLADSAHPGFEINAGGFPRRGGVWLLGQPGGRTIRNLKREGFVSLWLKSSHPEPMALVFYGEGGQKVGRVRLFGKMPSPVECGAHFEEIQNLGSDGVLDVKPDLDWRQVAIPLSYFFNDASTAISGFTIESDPYAGYQDVTQPANLAIVTVAPPEFSDSAPAQPAEFVTTQVVEPSATSLDAMARSLFAVGIRSDADEAAKKSLLSLLDDPRDEVALNVLAAYTRVNDPAAIPGLANKSHGLNHRVAEQATKALVFQNTDAAWAEIKRTMEIMPYDFCREFSVRALAEKKDNDLRSNFSVMAVRTSWRLRVAGAKAMGALSGPDPAKMLMLFVKNVDPTVRLTATELADPKVEDVCRNLLYGAVNDESDIVRMMSCWKLMQSPIGTYASEGQKGVRDDSKWVRLMLLQMMKDHPSEAFRGALRLAVTDALPEVRAAALRAFEVMPGKVEAAEVQNLANDPDPRVMEAYRELAAAKGIGAPRELSLIERPSNRIPGAENGLGFVKRPLVAKTENPGNLSVRKLPINAYLKGRRIGAESRN